MDPILKRRLRTMEARLDALDKRNSAPRLHPTATSTKVTPAGTVLTVTMRNSGGWDALGFTVERVLVSVVDAQGARVATAVVGGVEGAPGAPIPTGADATITLRPLAGDALKAPKGGGVEVLRVLGAYSHVAYLDGQVDEVDYVFEDRARERALGLDIAPWRKEWNESWAQRMWRDFKGD